jgi:hypothetical protein
MGQWRPAIADYDSALRLEPNLASSLYGRGLAKHRIGDAVGGDTDINAAIAINASIIKEFAGYHVQQK